MAKTIFICPTFFYPLDKKQWETKKPYPPYGTLIAANLLIKEGYTVLFHDNHLENGPETVLDKIKKIKPDIFIIYDDGFNYLTKMCLTIMREAAFKMLNAAKLLECKTIISSSDSNDHFSNYLDNGADFVITGEAEITLKELVHNLTTENTENYNHIKGIVYSDNSFVQVNQKRPVLKDLDILPNPAWSLVKIEHYKSIWNKHQGYFSLNIATTRGCPFKCNWCAKPIYGNRYNSRSPERVVKEMKFLIENYEVEHFWVCDDIFGLKPGWVKEFNLIIKTHNIQPKYMIQTRADLLLKENTILELVESGLDTAWIGAESGSQKILDAMDKGITVEQIKKSTQLLKKYEVKIGLFLQFGYIDETQEDIDKTLDMLLDIMPDDIGVSVSYPLPETKFYEKVKSQLKEKQNWSDSDDLAMLYTGTFGPEFYKNLHRYIHKRFRGKQKMEFMRKNIAELPKGILNYLIVSMEYLYFFISQKYFKAKMMLDKRNK
jgi:anaerobic magnesium-protoporphyrin IX monomethyl ester cyclase